MLTRFKPLLLAALLGVTLFGAAGCLFSPDDDVTPPPPPPPVLQFPDTPDKLMANFRTAYSTMDIDAYDDVLHPDFRFLFKPEDAATLPTSFYIKAEELQVARNMFSGDAIVRPEGTVPGISSITIHTMDRQGVWSDVGPSDPEFPNTQRALFQVAIDFARTGDSTIQVTGATEFYVSSRDSLHNGAVRPYYQIRGWRDQTNS